MDSALANKVMDGFKDLLEKRFGKVVGFRVIAGDTAYQRTCGRRDGNIKLHTLMCHTMDGYVHRGTNISMFAIVEDDTIICTDWDGRQRCYLIGDPMLFNRMVGDVARCYVQYAHWDKQVNCESTSG